MNNGLKLPEIKTPFVKYVLIQIGRKTILEFESVMYRHYQILERLLRIKRIAYESVSKMPSPKGVHYEVLAMGSFLIDLDDRGCRKKTAIFYGESGDYRLHIEKEHLNIIKAANPDWEVTRGHD